MKDGIGLSGPKTAHFSRFVEESQEKTQDGHPVTKITYGRGDIIKTTFDDPWIVAGGVLVAQAYLVTSGSETTSVMRYRFLSPDYPVTLEILEKMLGLAFPTYLSYQRVPVHQIFLIVDPGPYWSSWWCDAESSRIASGSRSLI